MTRPHFAAVRPFALVALTDPAPSTRPEPAAGGMWAAAAHLVEASAGQEEGAKMLSLKARAQLGSTHLAVAPDFRDAILSLLALGGERTGHDA